MPPGQATDTHEAAEQQERCAHPHSRQKGLARRCRPHTHKCRSVGLLTTAPTVLVATCSNPGFVSSFGGCVCWCHLNSVNVCSSVQVLSLLLCSVCLSVSVCLSLSVSVSLSLSLSLHLGRRPRRNILMTLQTINLIYYPWGKRSALSLKATGL